MSYVVLANLRKMPGAIRSAVGGGVFGSLPSVGTRSSRLSSSGRLVIACGDQRPHAPKCRACLSGVPCNTSTARLRSVEAALCAADLRKRTGRRRLCPCRNALSTVGSRVSRDRNLASCKRTPITCYLFLLSYIHASLCRAISREVSARFLRRFRALRARGTRAPTGARLCLEGLHCSTR